MAIAIQEFNKEKALEAIIFVASKVQQPTYHKISKIFYFADKLHLERYGSLLSEDTYIAMDNGPVPSAIYDIMKCAAGRIALPMAPQIRDALSVSHYYVNVKRSPNMEYLSEAAVECLQEAMEKHGHKSFGQLTDESHDAAWNSVDENQPIPLKEIANTLPNAKEITEYLTI
jgi:uncharacterized phage-associated protein